MSDKVLFLDAFFFICVYLCVCMCVCGCRLLLGQWQGAPQPHYSLLLSHKSTTATSLSLSLSSFCFISVFFSLPTPCPLESADGTFFAERKRHTEAWAVEGDVVDKGKDVLLFYKGCSCLLRIDSLNWLPKPSFSPYISPSFYYTAHSGFLFYGVSGHSWILVILLVIGKKFFFFFLFFQIMQKYQSVRLTASLKSGKCCMPSDRFWGRWHL